MIFLNLFSSTRGSDKKNKKQRANKKKTTSTGGGGGRAASLPLPDGPGVVPRPVSLSSPLF